MAKNKTVETGLSVSQFVKSIPDDAKRKDFSAILELISQQTGLEPKMWGTAIVGFGSYHYHYESGREGDAPLAGLAARAGAITFYLSSEFDKRDELLSKLGKHKTGKGCLYVQRLADIDQAILMRMIKATIAHRKKLYPAG